MQSSNIYVTDKELGLIKAILRALLTGQKVYVFGSRVRGDHRKTSDIDLAISGKDPISMELRSKLEFEFAESDLPYRVDIVDLATVDESFRNMIKAEAVKLELQDD
jgi:predicted nucleotidyltransferase